MEDISVTRARPDDLTAIRALLGRCGLPTEDLSAAHAERFWICRAAAGLIGTVGIEPLGGDVGLLRSLAVAPEARGKRIGHALWARARDEAQRLALRRLYLLTTTAAPLFSRWGFARIDRGAVPGVVQASTEYSTLCPSTAVVMVLDLAPAPGPPVG